MNLERLMEQLRAMPAGTLIPASWVVEQIDAAHPVAKTTPGVGAVASSALDDFTVEALAEELGRSGSTIRGWLADGAFPTAYKLRKREWRIPREDVRRFLTAQPRRPAAAQEEAPGFGSDDLSSWRDLKRTG